MNERIAIAKQFKPVYEWKNATHKEKQLKRATFGDFILTPFLLFVAVVCSSLEVFEVSAFTVYWPKAGLLVGFAAAISFRAPFTYIEVLLEKHIAHMLTSKRHSNTELDQELNRIVNTYNKRTTAIYLKRSPLIIISLAATLQVLDNNIYWDYFAPFVLIVSVFYLAQIAYDIFMLKTHIKKAESFFM